MVLEGLIHDSKMTKKKLSSWVKSGNTMETVGARLGLQQGLSLEKNAEHMNYEALVKFIRMKFEAENAGKQLPSVENVGKYLGVWGLPLNQQRIHANWRAFKRYSKMYAEYQKLMKPIRFSYIGSGYQTEEKTKEIMLKWAMAKSQFADVKQTLGLTGLSGQQLTEHVNYEALQLFKGYVEEVKRLEETVAAENKGMGRQPLKEGGGRKERKNVRTSTTFETRLAVIKHFEESGDMAATVERFFPALSVQAKRSKKRVVYGWIKDREKIESACDSVGTAKSHRLRKSGVGLTLSNDAEKCIVVWLRSMQKLGVPVTGTMLSEHALDVAKELGIDSALFTASVTWRKSFLKRHKLTM
ncbi:hypothetical protein PF006_g27236 [Phytophthora fragariae]|uniref:HTH CENPB-type domain-containing protein n=1 Tax=Phytophthora fragariae TaxID=53985 RepID=A0A6A3QQ47_9STRA|nr:hypothetical protein PF006_g27236 [Phytophthora fragariae]